MFYVNVPVSQSTSDGEEGQYTDKTLGVLYKAAVSILQPTFSGRFGISMRATVRQENISIVYKNLSKTGIRTLKKWYF